MEKVFHLKEIDSIAKEIVNKISLHEKGEGSSLVLCLRGELGAGKTTLTKSIAKELEVKEDIVSPTFVIMKRYNISKDNFENLFHVDAYRIENEEEILVLGWEEIIKNRKNLVLVEWPEKIEKYLPKKRIEIKLVQKSEEEREISYHTM